MGNCFCFRSANTEPEKKSSSDSNGGFVSNNNNETLNPANHHHSSSTNLNVQHHKLREDALEQSEMEELIPGTSPAHHLTFPEQTSSHGKKLIKKPINLLNGSLGILNKESQTQDQSSVLQSQISDNKINCLFEEYKDSYEDEILASGIERLCCDLQYKPEDFAILVLAWRLNANQMCRFTKTEFIQGLQELNADSIDSIRIRLEQQIQLLMKDGEAFKSLYRFTFKFGLEPGLRTLSLDMAMSLWRLVFTIHTPAIMDKWMYFLSQHPQIRGIPKDTWQMFLNFAETCDIYNYNDEDSWPSLFDDFVEFENERGKRETQDHADGEGKAQGLATDNDTTTAAALENDPKYL